MHLQKHNSDVMKIYNQMYMSVNNPDKWLKFIQALKYEASPDDQHVFIDWDVFE